MKELAIKLTSPVAIAIIALLAGILLGKLIQKIKDRKKIKNEREDAVKRSRSIIGGQAAEQVAPFLPNFPCNPGDARFIGKPVDFVAFPGASENQEIKEILLIEVKTGDSQLSAREKQIRDAVEKGRIRYVEYRI